MENMPKENAVPENTANTDENNGNFQPQSNSVNNNFSGFTAAEGQNPYQPQGGYYQNGGQGYLPYQGGQQNYPSNPGYGATPASNYQNGYNPYANYYGGYPQNNNMGGGQTSPQPPYYGYAGYNQPPQQNIQYVNPNQPQGGYYPNGNQGYNPYYGGGYYPQNPQPVSSQPIQPQPPVPPQQVPPHPFAPQPGQPMAVPMAPPASSKEPVFESYEEQRRFFEKKAVKSTAANVGGGLLIFYAVVTGLQLLFSVISETFRISDRFLEDPAFLLVFNMVLTLIGFTAGAFFIMAREKAKPTGLAGFGKPKKGYFFPSIMVGIGFCYVANIVVTVLQVLLPQVFQSEMAGIVSDSPKGVFGFLLSVLSTAVFPAILEEFIFRVAIMGSLLKFGKPFAIFASAFLFGLVHGNMVQIPFAFLVGLVIGFAVIQTGSIWTGVIIHFLNNFISVVLDYVGIYFGDDIQTAIYLIVLAVVLLIGLFGVYLLSRKNKNFLKFEKTAHVSKTSTRFGWLCSTATIIIFFVIVALEVNPTTFLNLLPIFNF